MSKNNRTLKFSIISAMLSLLMVTVISIVVYSYVNNSRAIKGLSDDLINNISSSVVDNTFNFLSPVSTMSETGAKFFNDGMISFDKDLTDKNNNYNKKLERFCIEMVNSFPQQTMFYVGSEKGEFVGAYSFDESKNDGLQKTKIVYFSEKEQKTQLIYNYFDKKGNIVRTEVEKDSSKSHYDPTIRPWYIGAKTTEKAYWSDLYIFASGNKPGITASFPVICNNEKHEACGTISAVIGADIEISRISEFLQDQKVGKTGVIYIINEKEQLVGYNNLVEILKSNKKLSTTKPLQLSGIGEPWLYESFLKYKNLESNKVNENESNYFTYQYQGTAYITSVLNFPEKIGKKWKLFIVVPENDFFGIVKKVNYFTLFVSSIILIFAVFIAILVSRNLSRPIESLTLSTEKIKNFHLDENININSSIKEVQRMVEAVNTMKNGLSSFKKYVPANLVRQLIEAGEVAKIGGKKKNMSIIFTDIVNFTGITQEMPVEDTFPRLSKYFTFLAEIIASNKGTVDKYLGDSIMAFWNAPFHDNRHAYNSCKTALECCKMNEKLKEAKKDYYFPSAFVVHTGENIVGNIGSDKRMNYTIIGDSVNIASRMINLNKVYDTHILISEDTYNVVEYDFICRPIDIVIVKGSKKPMKLYELLELYDPKVFTDKIKYCEQFESAFDLYHDKKWDKALDKFILLKTVDEYKSKIYEDKKEDKLLQIYIERCKYYRNRVAEEKSEDISTIIDLNRS